MATRTRYSIPPDKAFWLLAWLWLPLGVVIVSILRFTLIELPAEGINFSVLLSLAALLPLAVTAPFGLPLALACRKLYRKGYVVLTYVLFIVLGLATAFCSIFAGLLGPIAIAIAAGILSLPAWLLYGVLHCWSLRKH